MDGPHIRYCSAEIYDGKADLVPNTAVSPEPGGQEAVIKDRDLEFIVGMKKTCLKPLHCCIENTVYVHTHMRHIDNAEG